MSWPAIVFLSILLLNIIFGLIIIFREQKSAQATWAWLMVLFFIPVIGLILYFIFGRELRNSSWNENALFKTNSLLLHQREAFQEDTLYRKSPSMDGLESLIYMHLTHSHAPLTYAQSVDLLTDGDQKFASLFQDIKDATNYIHLQYFSINTDELGDTLISLLTDKAKQGVQVMLLYDGLGSYKITKRYLRDYLEAGGRARAFFPPRSMFTYGSLNHRNHRKLGIIDGKVGYLGGFNIGDKYNTEDSALGYWRDSHLRMTGSAVHHLHDQFISDWNKGKKYRSKAFEDYAVPVSSSLKGGVPMQIVASGPGFETDQVKNGFIQMIQNAKKYIYIQTPYFIPDIGLLDNLRVAILSGIDVRIMIPNKPDHPFIYWATYFHIGELLRLGATIYIYDRGFLHAKTMVVDDRISTIGTTNMDVRSVSLNFEVNTFMYDEDMAIKMKSTFQDDIIDCHELTLEEYEQRSNWVRIKENIARLLSPLL
ncbi:cardiolipin synthetase [Geomicrobium sp. JCM 19037]|uniref:cardiolipin synthase n=1 Tax=unclassified Geomicrobium TaxID=2628951 RepID=UPI00045F4271|nr:cardiolipin synthase [Geomicrobium sp. JCM 19037]GAK02694.1 cardiolipin synthetase [Geomicrobium sp. JCM 19037]